MGVAVPDSGKRDRLEALLTALKMTGVVGLYHIEEPDGQLFLNVNPGHRFEGNDLAKEIADMSNGDIEAKRIKVRTTWKR